MDNRESALLEMQKFIRKETQKKNFRAVEIDRSKDGVEVKMMGLKLRFNGETCRALMNDGFVIEMPPAETEFLRQLFLDGSRMTPAEFRDSRAGKRTNYSPAAKMPKPNMVFDVVWNMLAVRMGIDPVAEKDQRFNDAGIKQLKQDELRKAQMMAAQTQLEK